MVRYVEGVASQHSTIIYPNPTAGSFSIQPKSSLGYSVQVKVIDLNGKVVKQVTSSKAATINVNMEQAAAGVYVVQLIGNAGTETLKLIKK